jgi:cytidylate kinase
MGIITISREMGAGETTIAPAVAERLGWRVADQSILNRECEITGITLPHALHWDEHDPTFMERLHGQGPEFAAFLNTTRQVMQQLAAEDDFVIVGRGGGLLLRGHANALHVRLIAGRPFRIRRVMEARWVADEVAGALLEKSDRNRALFYRHVFHVDWKDPMHYDMVLRTDLLGIERVVDILAGYFERSGSSTRGATDKRLLDRPALAVESHVP